MSHIRRRGKRWQARYRGPDGRERSQTFDRKADAERWLTTMQASLLEGTWLDPAAGRITVAEWAEQWQASTGPGKRPTTLARERSVLANHILPVIGDYPVGKVTRGQIRELVAAAQAKGLAASSVQQVYATVRSLFSAAIEHDLIAVSPCRAIKLPSMPSSEPRFLSSDELHRLADAIEPRYRVAVFLAGVMGLRWAEVTGLRVCDIDFLRRQLTVSRSIVEVRGRLHAGGTKTAASRRTMSMPKMVVEEVAAHLAQWPAAGEELVCRALRGGPMRAPRFSTAVWAPAIAATGLEGLTFHGLRHTAAGLLIEAGVHPRVIQQRMGHSSIKVTMDVYGHLLPAVDEAVADSLDTLLAGAAESPAVNPRSGANDE